jgi:hypothetical protein
MKYYYDDAVECDGMRTTETSMKRIRNTKLWSEEQREWDHLVDPRVNGSTILKRVMKEQALVAKTGFIWFRE